MVDGEEYINSEIKFLNGDTLFDKSNHIEVFRENDSICIHFISNYDLNYRLTVTEVNSDLMKANDDVPLFRNELFTKYACVKLPDWLLSKKNIGGYIEYKQNSDTTEVFFRRFWFRLD